LGIKAECSFLCFLYPTSQPGTKHLLFLLILSTSTAVNK
jgi:hypothetical protein